ncbi:MAG TPA: hypothetical protein DCM05_08610 [Elusimicrobia bacterium]|nr:hypothetical protein [Elusimicrobiota bacterium]
MTRILMAAFFSLAAAAAAQQPEFQDVKVKAGDTLWSISNKYLKNPKLWNEILKHNKMPTSDPTVPLPGMTLKVPKELIKEDLRSAELIQLVKKVLARKKDKADWDDARLKQELYHGDGLRTLADSRAGVRFFGGGILSVDPNSMAILKAPRKEDHDLQLTSGGVYATNTRIRTPSAYIVPKSKDSTYKTSIQKDLTTKVEVFKGAAEVSGGGKTMEVSAGKFTDVPVGRAPAAPVNIPNFAQLQASAPQIQASAANVDLISSKQTGVGNQVAAPDIKTALNIKNLEVGIPVAAYRLQVSQTQGFEKMAHDKVYDIDEPMNLVAAGLRGRYWVRVAIIDLLGSQGRFSAPQQVQIGK